MRDKEGYWYKNETLIDRVGITKAEQKHMKTIIGVFEYHGKKEKNDIILEIEPIVSKYLWNKINKKR